MKNDDCRKKSAFESAILGSKPAAICFSSFEYPLHRSHKANIATSPPAFTPDRQAACYL